MVVRVGRFREGTMDVVKYLHENIEKCTKKRIYFNDGKKCEKSKTGLAKHIASMFGEIFNEIKEDAEKGPQFVEDKIRKNFSEILSPFVKEFNLPTISEGGATSEAWKYSKEHLAKLVPVANIEGTDKKNIFYMMDSEENRYSPVSYASWEQLHDPDYVKALKQSALPVITRYLPNRTESILPMDTESEGLAQKFNCLNTYIPPAFKLNPIENPNVPDMLMEFLHRLFVNDGCFDFMMESIWYVLNDRLQVIPVLNGGTGIGKGLFTEILLSGLVGGSNSIIAPISWDKSGFNAWLRNKQLIIFDEAKIISHGTDANVDILKRLMNDSLNIERKGIDADTLVQNHASFFITSNNGAKRFKLELDNRRFSPVDVTTEKVEWVYKKKQRDELVAMLFDKEILANFYWYIQNEWSPKVRKNDRTPHTILKCESLYKFQYESLEIWQRAIVDTILNGESNSYTYAEVNANYRKIYTQVTGKETNSKRTIELADAKDFVQSYKHHGDDKTMGHFEVGPDDLPVLKVNEQYFNENSNDGFSEVGGDGLSLL